MKTFTRTLLLSALLGVTAPALAGPDHPGHGPDPAGSFGRHLAHAVQRLELSTEQEDTIRAIFAANRDDLKANFEAGRALKEEMRDLLSAEVLDEEALADIAVREGSLAEERVLLTVGVAAQVLAELTDEQKAELQAMRSERSERRRERFGARRSSD